MLDIGCHVGAFSLQIASYFEPENVLGVDIDHTLIKAAISNMHKLVNDVESRKHIAANMF